MKNQEIIPKGKYKGETVAYVLEKNPQYIIDMMDKQRLYFSEEVLEEAQSKVEFSSYLEMDKDYEYRRVFREKE